MEKKKLLFRDDLQKIVFTRSYHCLKCPKQSFLWSVFPRVQTEHGDLLCKSTNSVQIRENTDQKKLRIWETFKAA